MHGLDSKVVITQQRYEELIKAEAELAIIRKAFRKYDRYDFKTAVSFILEDAIAEQPKEPPQDE